MSSPWNDRLPTSVEIAGERYEIRSDYRQILDICQALADPNLDGVEKSVVLLTIFYPGVDQIQPKHYEEAIKKCFWFINCGSETGDSVRHKLMDWEQDFQYIVAPINRVAGTDVRSVEYMHWWTFIGYYYEIGDCLFAQIVRIRKLLAQGKKLDKNDQKWYSENRSLVDLNASYTDAEQACLSAWGVK